MPALKKEYITASDDQTVDLGRELAREMRPPLLVLLIGELAQARQHWPRASRPACGWRARRT